MKKTRIIFFVIILVSAILLMLLNHYMSYSMRIGDTQFYLVETAATSKDGRPLLGLYCKDMYGGYKGVNMSVFPRFVFWNDTYLISKNCDGNNTKITRYIVINRDSVNESDGDIAVLHIFKTEMEYRNYLNKIDLSEAEMKQIDNHITWWKLLFK